ncbi:PadR family transcriptional regulator [Hyperthermus butylicus]|uniref:Transcriptional regulator n=1 Tax=Hyperthermus butylicus (strain DSM 5456 / JCM 9403 / PLM1-5) TaxID=415426 RepID=A2BMT4_HYPBU|nr:PadR family transcriptional regulator [Hyperthermus butylicus]ABM81295.1 putative transcriptional regulator [Hyperthermus butylicus DSM 5456]
MQRPVEIGTRYLVLMLLAEGPKTGYELIKQLRSLFARYGGRASPGTVYPVLRRLEEEGLIRSRLEPYGARVRKVYELTGEGLRALLEMMSRWVSVLETALQLHIPVFRRAGREDGDTVKLVEEVLERLEAAAEQLEKLLTEARRVLRQAKMEATAIQY